MRRMITFTENDVRFNCRIVGVAIHAERVLLHRAEWDDFWSLPGGRAELLEPAAETLKREMGEELVAEVTVERLLWVVENFFKYRGERCASGWRRLKGHAPNPHRGANRSVVDRRGGQPCIG